MPSSGKSILAGQLLRFFSQFCPLQLDLDDARIPLPLICAERGARPPAGVDLPRLLAESEVMLAEMNVFEGVDRSEEAVIGNVPCLIFSHWKAREIGLPLFLVK